MDITFDCNKCGQHIAIDEAGAGMVVNCPSCEASLKVPNQSSSLVVATPVLSVATSPPSIANSNTDAASPTSLVNCSACGKQISIEANSCPSCGQPNKSKKITCPNCKSANVQKIQMGSKLGAAVLFGVFAMSRLTKTWECSNCKYKW